MFPKELLAKERWIVRQNKRPIDPATGKTRNDPEMCVSYQKAKEACLKLGADGVGYMFVAGDGITGVDLDHCYHDGQFEPWAKDILDHAQTYSEFSPSGTGVHLYFHGEKPAGPSKESNVEMYDRGRYFTVTGKQVPGTPNEVADGKETLQWIMDTYLNPFKEEYHTQSNYVPTGQGSQKLISDALDHLDPASLNYNQWVLVGMALKQEGFGPEVWDEWSQKDPNRYKGHKDISVRWKSFKGGGRPVTGATIVKLAKEKGGWEPQGSQPEPPPVKTTGRIYISVPEAQVMPDSSKYSTISVMNSKSQSGFVQFTVPSSHIRPDQFRAGRKCVALNAEQTYVGTILQAKPSTIRMTGAEIKISQREAAKEKASVINKLKTLRQNRPAPTVEKQREAACL